MSTLAFDTSTAIGGVAIADGSQRILSRRIWRREKSHGEYLTAAVVECLQEAGLDLSAIEQIAVGIGPGSFTGIRIAVNAARTLGYGLDKPIKAFNTLEILAFGALEIACAQKLPILTLLSAQKNLLYAAYFETASGQLKVAHEPAALTFEKVVALIGSNPCLCVGDGFEEWSSSWNETSRANLLRNEKISDEPLPEVLAKMAQQTGLREKSDWRRIQPLYLRASEPEQKLKAGLLKDRSKLNE